MAEIFNNRVRAGTLTKDNDGYVFRYDDGYFNDPACEAISLSLPKTQQVYRASKLFPFFYGLLSEGINKQTQCRLLRIDENDHFSLLLATASTDTIGAITVKEMAR